MGIIDKLFIQSYDSGLKRLLRGVFTSKVEMNTALVNTVAESGVYDVSSNNSGATFASLAALLSAQNLNTLIPKDKRKGGMSVKFIRSSDNKYVQYRLMANAWSTTITDWQGVDDIPTIGSNNLVTSGGVESRLNKGLCMDFKYYFDLADTTLEIGSINPSTGEEIEQNLTRRTGFIPIDKLQYYYLIEKKSVAVGPVNCNWFFYNENKEFISVYYSFDKAQNKQNVNASYVRLTMSTNYSVGTIQNLCLIDRCSRDRIVARNSFYITGINVANHIEDGSVFNPKEKLSIVDLSVLRRAGLLRFKSKNICNPAKALRGCSVEYDGKVVRGTNWEQSTNYLQVLDCIDPDTKYTLITPYNNYVHWFDANDIYIGSEYIIAGTRTVTSPSNAYILRYLTFNTNIGYVNIGETLYNVAYQDGYVVNEDLLPGNASGNYDFSNYVYEAIGDSRTAGYAMNTNYNNNGEISSWPASPTEGYYQITQDGTYNGIEAKAGDGIYYNGSTAKLIKGGYSYINDNGKVCVWPAGGTYPQVIGEKTSMIVNNHAYAGAAFCERTWMSAYTPYTGYNQALQISPSTNIVTIFLGVNDAVAGADAPVANMCQRDNENDIYDVQTFKGAIRQTIKNIRLIAPMAMIIFINEDDGSTGYDGGSSKAQMIEEVAEEYRLPVLNLCHCGVDPRQDIPYLDTKYQSRTDGLHESTVGQNFLARVVGGEIKKYLW